MTDEVRSLCAFSYVGDQPAGPALACFRVLLVKHGSAAMPKANRSAFSGVTWDRRHGKWMVQIRLGHRHVRLGYLDDFDDARRVYLGARLLLQGFTPVPRAELRLPEVRGPTGWSPPSDRRITRPPQ
jgi:hypothetical protein